jgi:hypothetical protein
MPPQQRDRLLDFFGDGFGFGAHGYPGAFRTEGIL